MRVGSRLALTGLAATAVALGWWLLGPGNGNGVRPPTKTAAPVPVTIAVTAYRDLPLWRSGIGTVQPCNAVTITPQVDGRLLRVACEEGQDVEAGAVLAQIDPRPFAAQLRQTQANQARDQAQLDNARTDCARHKRLVEQGIVTQQTIEALEASVQALTATVQADQAAVDLAQLQLEYTNLTAPFPGRTGLRLVDPGTVVHPGSGIVTLTQMSPIAVVFTLSQDHVQAIREAMHGGLQPQVSAYTRDGSNPLATGTLDSMDSQIDSATGQIRLKATFPNTDRALWPGALVSARLLIRTAGHVLVIPAEAIQRGQTGIFVFVVGADDTVALRPIAIGETEDGVVIVDRGLAADDRVVVRGQYRLEAGTKVEAHVMAAAPAP
jgi:multidrug efflux system membrane fusion protein